MHSIKMIQTRICVVALQLSAVIVSATVQKIQLDPSTSEQSFTYKESDAQESNVVDKFIFEPPNYERQTVHSQFYLQINISSSLSNYATHYSTVEGSKFFVGLRFDKSNKRLTNMLNISPAPKVSYEFSRKYNLSYFFFWQLQANNSMNLVPTAGDEKGLSRNGVRVTVMNIGYPNFELHIIEKKQNSTDSNIIHKETYYVTAIREYRTVDLGFTIAITVVGILNIYAIGCMTETPVLKAQLKKSIIPVCLASGTQYIVTPLITFGLIKLSEILPEIGVGILLCACVPGGGLGHLIVLVTGNANTELSVAINFLQICVPLGTVPLWLYSIGQFLENGVGEVEVPTHFMVLCLALLLVPYVLGVLTKHFEPSISDAILNWLIKPLLLLFMILFITLGLYINIYAMGVLDKVTLAMAGLVPSLGFCIGGGLTLVVNQGKASAKSVAIEAAIMNCLAVVAAAKFTMKQPDSDMACAGAIAVLFFTPLPFLGMLIFHKIKKKIMGHFENRKFKKEQQETITKSFALITQNALQISGMTPNQIDLRRNDTDLNNFDRTLLSDDDNSEPNQTVVQIKEDEDPSVETVPLTQSNHRNYL